MKHGKRRLRRLKPDDLLSPICTGLIAAIGVFAMFVAGDYGIYAVVFLMVVVAFVVGVATRGVKRVVRMIRSRSGESLVVDHESDKSL